MPTPIREQVIEKLRGRLARLVTSGECLRSEPYEDADEFVALWDQEEVSEKESFGRVKNTIGFICVFSKSGSLSTDFSTQMNGMLAELIKQVSLNDSAQIDISLDGLASSAFVASSTMYHPDSNSLRLTIQAVIAVEYPTKLGDPYSQP